MIKLTPQIAEIVSFKLSHGTDAGDFVKLIESTGKFTEAAPGFVSRQLSCGDDGVWTDLVIWSSMDHAKAAQEEFPKQDFAPAVMAAIDNESFEMKHQQIYWHQE